MVYYRRDYTLRVKTYFTKELLKKAVPTIRNKRGEYNVWQNRFWDQGSA